jgi:hydrogenase/urease accessory protein HupE
VSRVLIVSLGLLALAPVARAHEIRPAYLEIKETAPGRYDVLWRTPVLSGMRLPVVLKLPEGVRNVGEPAEQELADSLLERRSIDAGAGGLAGRRIEFEALEATLIDVLVRVVGADGGVSTTLVHPSQPWIDVPARQGVPEVMAVYVQNGIEHILGGPDHLLFVLGLMLLVRSAGRLVKTITAFTVAHSITLALATLGVVRLPGPPIEAAIALSILLLGVEIVRMQRGETSLTLERPWAVAFAFGLLHGIGFAGALIRIGLPHSEIPLALFSFNVGVEIAQLGFVAAILPVLTLLRRLRIAWPAWARLAPAYAIGSLAAFWFFDRLAGFASL